MARQPRIDLPGLPQHIIQRGNNRQACFFTASDYQYYLHCLHVAAQKYACPVHAYVLMTNHVHLLATGAEMGAIGRMMQSVGRRYVRYLNSTYQRTGTLWEGRFKSCLVDAERYLFVCYRYIELNPVRARMVADPGDYQWSSFRCNALGREDEIIAPHACYLSLGDSAHDRRRNYLKLFGSKIDTDDIKAIRNHVNQGKVLGSRPFKNNIAAALNRRVDLAGPGRPKNVL